MICNSDSWPKNYLTMPKAFWTSMLHSFRLLCSFPKRFTQGPTWLCWRDVCGPYFWHLQCLWNCCSWLVVLTVLRSGKDHRYGFEISRKNKILVFVFSLLVRLIWFCKMAKLNDLIPTIFALKYGGKPHAQEWIFQRSRPTKIKIY